MPMLPHAQSLCKQHTSSTDRDYVDQNLYWEEEAGQAGRLLLKAVYDSDICFTSVLNGRSGCAFVLRKVALIWSGAILSSAHV